MKQQKMQQRKSQMPKPTDTEAGKERVQKVLANAGLGSRREIEQWIREGRIRINGRLAQLGDRVATDDQLKLDGKTVNSDKIAAAAKNHHIIIYNKPEGEIVSRDDPDGRKTVFRKLPKIHHGRWISVGRLDINSSGLLIFTTHGELANRLMHPSTKIEREYAVRVNGEVTEEMIKELVNGIQLEDGFARFEDVVESGGEGRNRWYHVVIMEGRKREVRRLWEAVGCRVNRLKRVRFGPIILDSSVKVGQWRELDKVERRSLLDMAELPDKDFNLLPKYRPSRKKADEAGTPKKRKSKSVWRR
jgi:23S rRNA pseudouridine2605 synthase